MELLRGGSERELLKLDFFDWGYTMGCPWPSYRPDLAAVEFRVKYQPKVGPPLFSDTARVTLAGPGKPGYERR